MAASPKNPVLRIIRQTGLVRPVDLETRGISRAQLYRLVRKGLVARQARGIYVASQHSYTTEHTLAQVAKRVPIGAFCLLTALRFHGLTTQSPAEVWIALPEKARKPRLDTPRLRVARFSGAALSEGIATHRLEGVEVRVYSAAKTVADCFKYRSRHRRGGGGPARLQPPPSRRCDRAGPLRGHLPGDAHHAALPGRDRMSGRKSGLAASVAARLLNRAKQTGDD